MERPGTARTSTKNPTSPLAKTNVVNDAYLPVQGLSFAQRKAHSLRSSKSSIVEGSDLMRNIDRPPPGDPTMNRRKSQANPGLSKRTSAYYENEFAVGRESNSALDRVRNEALVIAELKTNVIIDDEFSFITDLSYHLSNRYQRSMSSIVVNLQHGMCMMFGGSFDPAYTLTIHALPGQVQPTTNKRNAALIQTHVKETLGVPASRGYVRFVASPEENVAHGGKTVAGEMEDVEKGARDSIDRLSSKSASTRSKRMLKPSFGSFRPSSAMSMREGSELPTPPSSSDEPAGIVTIPEHSPVPSQEEKSAAVDAPPPVKTATHRKSFVSLLFKTGSTKQRRPSTSGMA